MGRESSARKLARRALEIESRSALQAGELGFMARVLVQTTLPHSRPEATTFVRRNGALTMSIAAHPLYGLPYGRYPRLLLAWITTEAVRTRDPVIELGPSMNSFLARLGLGQGGGKTGPAGRLRDQMQRLFGATIAFTWERPAEGRWRDRGFRIAEDAELWWSPADSRGQVAWRSKVELSNGLFQELCSRPVPLDLRALRALRSPLALDVYAWLTYRSSYLERPTRIPWRCLAEQFGSAYSDCDNFRRRFVAALRKVLVVYPSARVQPVRGGLLLRPARPHVSRCSLAKKL